jgi:preprotein translocase subunit YajC
MNLLYVLENATEAPTGGSILPTILMLVAVVAVFFFMSRSQKKQEREAADMRNSIMVGDEITTIGGIIGRVVKVTEETVVIETGKDRTKLHMLKSAIRSVDVHAADTIEAAEKAEKADK